MSSSYERLVTHRAATSGATGLNIYVASKGYLGTQQRSEDSRNDWCVVKSLRDRQCNWSLDTTIRLSKCWLLPSPLRRTQSILDASAAIVLWVVNEIGISRIESWGAQHDARAHIVIYTHQTRPSRAPTPVLPPSVHYFVRSGSPFDSLS